MSECIFCKIVKEQMDAEIVFENEYALAFLDANPSVDGHTLVVPREHFERFEDLSEEVAAGIFAVAKEVNRALHSALEAEGVNLGINDGGAAGQVVPHVHVHMIPRYSGDGGGSFHSIISKKDQEDPSVVAEKLKTEIY